MPCSTGGPSQLSGGQQQRVALARALVKQPHLLLLDEPLSNLDAGLRLTMRTEIRRIQRELGVTTILVTHDQIEATTMADRVVVMNGGRIEQEGAADDLYERPDTLFVASFIGSPPINLFDGIADGGVLSVHDARIPLAESGERRRSSWACGPRACRCGDGGTPARVTAAEPMGREVLYTADSAFGVIRFLEAGAEPRHREGDNVPLVFAPASALSSTRRAAAGSMCGSRLDQTWPFGRTDQGSDRNRRQLSEAALRLQAKRSVVARQLWLFLRPAPTRTRASRICKTAGQGRSFRDQRPEPGRHRHHDRR